MIEVIKFTKNIIYEAYSKSPLLLFLAIGFILFAPKEWLLFLDILKFRETHIEKVSLGFIALSCILIQRLFYWLYNSLFIKWWQGLRFKKSIRDYLQNLSTEEKQVLCSYVLQDKKTNYFDPGDGVIAGLIHNHVLYAPCSTGNLIDGIAYNINSYADLYLHNNINFITEDVPKSEAGKIIPYESGVTFLNRNLRY